MITRKMPWDLNPEETDLLHKAVDTDDHSGGVNQVTCDIIEGALDLWVWETNSGLCLIVTQVGTYRDGEKELCVAMFAGHRPLGRDLVKELSSVAGESDCSSVVAYIKPHLAEKFGVYEEGSFLNDKQMYVVVGFEV